MDLRKSLVAAGLMLAGSGNGIAATCGLASSVNGVTVTKIDNALLFETRKLEVDADGAPNSYLVNGKGLSQTCDGVVAIVNGKRVTPKSDKAHWYGICKEAWRKATSSGDYSHVSIFGFLTDPKTNKPIVQKAGDPLPGKAYITTTWASIPGTRDGTQRHWIDATAIPYIVLPPGLTSPYGVKTSALSVVYRVKTQKMAVAIFGDRGDFGEGSVRLHQDLGHDPISRADGVDRANLGLKGEVIATLVFPKQAAPGSADNDAWRNVIADDTQAAFEKWGGPKRLKACAGM